MFWESSSRPAAPAARILGLVLLAALTGCDRGPQAQLPPVTPPAAAPPWQLPAPQDPGAAADPTPFDPSIPSADPALQQTPEDADDAPQRPPARNPLIRGLGDLAGRVPLEDDETGQLLDSLSEADQLLTEIKDENQRAIRELNRQVQLKSERHPNLVVVVAERLGARQLGCCGGSLPTPAIDRVAAEGAVLRQFYAGGASPAESMWSLMTGLDTSKIEPSGALPSRMVLAEMMWRAGYQTAFVGNWRLPAEGRLRGFDDWLGTVAREGQQFPAQLFSRESQIRIPANAGGKQEQFADDLYIEEALSVLRRRDRRKPFLLIVSLTAPGAAEQLGVDDIAAKMVQRLDRDIAQIDAELKVQKLVTSTALIVTSSGPPAAGQSPWKGRPGDLYEGGLRVPLIVRWPPRIPAGSKIDEPFGICDLMPTFGAFAGAIRQPRGMHGVAMTNHLYDKRRQPLDRMLYWQKSGPQGFAQAVRKGDWKVVRQAGNTRREDVELYNLAEDPEETVDVADQHPDVLESFLRGG